jgi:hypothetical protein
VPEAEIRRRVATRSSCTDSSVNTFWHRRSSCQ